MSSGHTEGKAKATMSKPIGAKGLHRVAEVEHAEEVLHAAATPGASETAGNEVRRVIDEAVRQAKGADSAAAEAAGAAASAATEATRAAYEAQQTLKEIGKFEVPQSVLEAVTRAADAAAIEAARKVAAGAARKAAASAAQDAAERAVAELAAKGAGPVP